MFLANNRAQASTEYTIVWLVVLGFVVAMVAFVFVYFQPLVEVTQAPETPPTAPAEKEGSLLLAITDSPVLDYSALFVTISGVEVHKDNKWISFQEGLKTFDLLQLADAADVIGKNNLPTGHYTQIKFQVDSSQVKLVDGSMAEVKIPSREIKLVSEFTVEEGKTTYLYLDFKPESLKKAGEQYILTPVIKVMALSEFKEDLCENRSVSCDDTNPCTVDSCDAGFCGFTLAQDGTSCGTGLVCSAGQCVSKAQVACSKLSFTTTEHKIAFHSRYVGWKGSSVLVDFDGDNDVDLLQGSLKSDEEYPWLPGYFYMKAKVLFNDGKGNFTDSGQFLGKATVWSAAGDIDGDGDNDVVTGTWGGGHMIVYFNDGKGYFTDSGQKLGGWIDFFPSLADFDGDNDLDIYSPIWPFHSPQSHVFLNDGKGVFSEYLESGLNIPGYGVYSGKAVFDVDKDNDIDIVEVSWSGETMPTRILKNNGKAQFTVSQEFSDVGGAVGVADFDNDNDTDFIASSFFKNDGNGIFTPRATPGQSYYAQQYYDPYYYLAVSDIDKIQGADFMYVYWPQAMLNNGDATFLECRLPDLYKVNYDTKTYYAFFPYEIGDIDNDGDIDMVGPAYSGSFYFDSNLSLSIALNNSIQ